MKFSEAINEVRNRIDIVDIISEYVSLKHSGSNFMGLCPFHNEKTASFSVNPDKQIFKCFGCGKGGNVYTFLMEHEGFSFREAVYYLAKRVNISIEDDYKQNNDIKKEKDVLYKLYKDVANEYYKILYSEKGCAGLKYLIGRKLTKETIRKFGLGYAPNDYGYMYKIMKEKGYDDTILIKSKLFIVKDNKAYDFFYDRVMFPLVDFFGNVVSFQGRILTSDNVQKYINTSENIIYSKSRNLFAINYAKLTKKDYFILCEGNMDVITLHQAGFDNAVASWGTAFTREQAQLIKKKVRKVYLCQDTDAAGVKAIKAAAKICDEMGIESYVIDLTPAKDPDEFINKFGREVFENKLQNPIQSYLFIISKLKVEFNLDNMYDYEKYVNTIVDSLSKFKEPLVRNKYIKEVALQEKLPYDELVKDVNKKVKMDISNNTDIIPEGNIHVEKIDKRYNNDNKILNNNNSNNASVDNNDLKEEKNNSNFEIEKYFVSILLSDNSLCGKIKDIVNDSEIYNNDIKEIYKMYITGKTTQEIIDYYNEKNLTDKNIINNIISFDKNNVSLESLNEVIKKIKLFNLNVNKKDDFDSIIEYNKNKEDILKKKYI